MTLDDFSVTMKIAYISRATLDSERRCNHLDLGTGSILGSQTSPRVLCGTKFRISCGRKTQESIGKVGNLNARIQQ